MEGARERVGGDHDGTSKRGREGLIFSSSRIFSGTAQVPLLMLNLSNQIGSTGMKIMVNSETDAAGPLSRRSR